MLEKSLSTRALSRNLATELAAGKPRKQAIAIGEAVKRRTMAEHKSHKRGCACKGKCGACKVAAKYLP